MTGELNGVGVQLTRLQPFMKNHHDVAHRQALACGDTVESASPFEQSTMVADTERDMNAIVSDHNRSCKRIRVLAAFQENYSLRVGRL